jgi:hemerythrin
MGTELNKEFSIKEYQMPEKHIKMFNILNHQGNANPNNREIPSLSS